MVRHLLLGNSFLLTELGSSILEPHLMTRARVKNVWVNGCCIAIGSEINWCEVVNARDADRNRKGIPIRRVIRLLTCKYGYLKILFLFIHCSKNTIYVA